MCAMFQALVRYSFADARRATSDDDNLVVQPETAPEVLDDGCNDSRAENRTESDQRNFPVLKRR